MTLLAPTLEAFFTQHMAGHREASPRTIGAYRDTWRLFLGYARDKTGTAPAGLDIAALDAGLISGFLAHLEQDRGNTARTRNARLAALRSFFKFAALRHPEHAATIARVLAIPAKKHGRTSVSYLTADEIKALLAAPDAATWHGRRDHAILALAIQTGLRSSEITGLTRGDVQAGTGPTVRCHGKGRKDRVTPLTANVAAVIRTWLRQQPGEPADPLFPAVTGRRLSSDAVQDLVSKHVATAAAGCPSIRDKNVTPHTMRHTAQRHADAGVAPDVLRELMSHRTLNATRGYYRVGEARRREAVDRVTALSFDRHGNRIWREARALLDAEHARYALGEVAVPYGACTEPSNVQAGGGACPVRFRCAGCDHFRTDVSHLPDLTAYLDDLLRTRERLAAAVPGVDEWARHEAIPSQEEITRIRRLIARVEGDIAGLGETERAQIDEAVTAIRRSRGVMLGMPGARPAAHATGKEASHEHPQRQCHPGSARHQPGRGDVQRTPG